MARRIALTVAAWGVLTLPCLAAAAEYRSIGEPATVLYDAPSAKAKPLFVLGRDTPLEVIVPPDLTVALERLSKRVGGALAFVSGRPLAELDLFFAPLKLPAIAGHGAEVRLADGSVHRATTFLDPELKAEIACIGDERPGVVIEDKGYSIAVHYRLAPQFGHEVRDEVSAIWYCRSPT